MTEREIATKILQAMDFWNSSYNQNENSFSRSLKYCFEEIFQQNVIGNLYYFAAIGCWNETEKWCNDVLKCEALKY